MRGALRNARSTLAARAVRYQTTSVAVGLAYAFDSLVPRPRYTTQDSSSDWNRLSL